MHVARVMVIANVPPRMSCHLRHVGEQEFVFTKPLLHLKAWDTHFRVVACGYIQLLHICLTSCCGVNVSLKTHMLEKSSPMCYIVGTRLLVTVIKELTTVPETAPSTTDIQHLGLEEINSFSL